VKKSSGKEVAERCCRMDKDGASEAIGRPTASLSVILNILHTVYVHI
jgi:hypothetical protein